LVVLLYAKEKRATECREEGGTRGWREGGDVDVDDCIGIGEERDSARRAHADGSRERISKVCSQLIIGTRPPLYLPFPPFILPRASRGG